MKQFWKKSGCSLLSALIFSTVLMGCGEMGADGSSVSSDNNIFSSTQSVESVVIQGKNKVYFEKKEGESDKYNTAIKAYNHFLSGKASAADVREETAGKQVEIADMCLATDEVQSLTFSLFDTNDDGIPELVLRSSHVMYAEISIFLFQDDQIKLVWQGGAGGERHPYTFLKNGACYSDKETTGYECNYTTIGKDGTATNIWFSMPRRDSTDDADDLYCFTDDTDSYDYIKCDDNLTKEKFGELTAEYFEAMKHEADIEWFDYPLEN